MNHNSVVKMMTACSSVMLATLTRPQSVITPKTTHSSVIFSFNTGLVKIMLTLMDYFSPADRRKPWVTD